MCAYLDSFIVYIKTKHNSLVKGLLRFRGSVNIDHLLGLHPSVLVVNDRFDNSVSNCLKIEIDLLNNLYINEVLLIVTLAMMYSASFGDSNFNLAATSAKEILE